MDDPQTDAIRILLVEDHRLFRRGLRDMLEEHGHIVVAEAATGREAVRLAAEQRPDVVVLDLNLPGASGVEVLPDLLAAAPRAGVLMMTGSSDAEDLLAAIAAGASGYLLKDATIEEMLAGIRAAAEGGSALSPAMAASLVRHVRESTGARRDDVAAAPVELSDRERDALRLVAAGRENAEIAAELHLSVGTVKALVATLLRKLGVENRVQAAVEAVRRGLA